MLTNAPRILVVDDELPCRRIITRMLQKEGFACREARDGNDAIECFTKDDFDVVVTDLQMPEMDGMQLCRRLAESATVPHIFVLSDAEAPRDEEELARCGVTEVFPKPIDYKRIVARIRDCCGGHGQKLTVEEGSADAVSSAATVEVVSNGDDQRDGVPDVRHDTRPIRRPTRQRLHALVLDPDERRSQALAEQLSCQRLQVSSAADLASARGKLEPGDSCDVVVIADDPANQFDALDAFDKLSALLNRAKRIALITIDEGTNDRIANATVDGVVARDVPPMELRAYLECLLQIGHGEATIPEAAHGLVRLSVNVPPIPQLLIKLMSYLPLPEVDERQLCRDIECDAGASGALLRAINSSSTGVRFQIGKVLDAIRLLGPRRAISIVISAAATTMQGSMLSKSSPEIRTWHQQRSLLTAVIASTFAKRMTHGSPETAFVIGILQDVGIAILAERYPKRYLPLLERLRTCPMTNLRSVESHTFQLTHDQVSAALLRQWQLPTHIVDSVLHHHHAPEKVPAELRDFAHVAAIGEAVADFRDCPHPLRFHKMNQVLGVWGEERQAECRETLRVALEDAHEAFRLFHVPMPSRSQIRDLLTNLSLPSNTSF